MVQKILVIIIGAAIAVYVCYAVYRSLFKKEYDRLCSGCPQSGKCGKESDERRECDCWDNKNGE